MNDADLVGIAIPATFFLMLAIERLLARRSRGRAFPPRKGWTWIGIAFFLLVGAMSAMAPLLIPEAWLAEHRLFDGRPLGLAAGTLVGWIVLSAVGYGWHRLQHAVPLFWRGFHQLHHSPQRVDMAGAFLFHPTEIAAQLVMASLVTTFVLGLEPLAAALTGYVAAFHAMFQHWNVRTPHWLGYLIQRPEAHCEHHRQGVHAGNYGDLPLWDLLLGTFKGPRSFDGEVGFEAPADRRIGAMLAFADVNRPLYGGGSIGVATTPSRSSASMSTSA